MAKALDGIRVLELGNLVAAPFAGKTFAEFGAEVVKVEDPEKGDALRSWRAIHENTSTSLWWYVQGRNKKSVTINLRTEQGQETVKELIKDFDIVIENFRPGTLEKWNIGYENLKAINPQLIMARISGYGQTGPYRDKVGFGSVGESIGGIRHLTGEPDQAPVRVGVPLGDSIAGLYAVIGTLMALRAREMNDKREGQSIDVALHESVFSFLEGVLPEYSAKGLVRERTGSKLPGIAPSNTYLCADGKYLVIAGNGDGIFKRLMQAIGRKDIAEDEKYSTNQGRAENVDELDRIIGEWTKKYNLKEAQRILDEARIPVGPIYNIEDIVNDEHYQARGMLNKVNLPDGEEILVPGIVPKLSDTPGRLEWVGPELGQHNDEILGPVLQDIRNKIK